MIGVWYDKNYRKLTLVLKSFKCSWNKCVFCCFSDEAADNYNDLKKTNFKILSYAEKINNDDRIDELVIFNGGSFFELPYEIILKISKLTEDKIVNIESRPEFVTEENISKTLTLLKPTQLIVRIGFESFFPEVRNALKKNIPQTEIQRIEHLRKIFENKNVKLVAYVLFGMNQISEESVEKSIKIFNNIFDGVIAIKYKQLRRNMPQTRRPSNKLISFLKINCLSIDMAGDELWKIEHKNRGLIRE